ncbi:MAG: hypothetical protein K9M03_04020 [Kiritimatiellales bacterium]|nr:hypothetical protein [Kiritimatiellales bacterium]
MSSYNIQRLGASADDAINHDSVLEETPISDPSSDSAVGSSEPTVSDGFGGKITQEEHDALVAVSDKAADAVKEALSDKETVSDGNTTTVSTEHKGKAAETVLTVVANTLGGKIPESVRKDPKFVSTVAGSAGIIAKEFGVVAGLVQLLIGQRGK